MFPTSLSSHNPHHTGDEHMSGGKMERGVRLCSARTPRLDRVSGSELGWRRIQGRTNHTYKVLSTDIDIGYRFFGLWATMQYTLSWPLFLFWLKCWIGGGESFTEMMSLSCWWDFTVERFVLLICRACQNWNACYLSTPPPLQVQLYFNYGKSFEHCSF